jgi:squalene-hopene/tetraprenyl-beta-curcumene cyclase
VELREELQDELSQGAELSRAFMINYHMYRHYFPVMAMARARAWAEKEGLSES